MKTLTKILVAASIGGGLSLSAIAGPGAQYFQRRVESAPSVTKPTNDGTVLACEHMLARNTGPTANRIPLVSVNCTPEMLKNGRECQSACGVPLAEKAVPPNVTCEHMLTSNTGFHRIPLMSCQLLPGNAGEQPGMPARVQERQLTPLRADAGGINCGARGISRAAAYYRSKPRN